MQELTNKIEIYDKACASSRIIIYGSGAVGLATISYLLKKGISKDKICVVVSRITGNAEYVFGIKVNQADDSDVAWNTSNVIIAVMGNLKNEIYNRVCQYKVSCYSLSDQLALELRHDTGDYRFEDAILQGRINNLQNENKSLIEKLARFTPQKELSYLIVNILDHCNLNCRGCDHFAPIAKERYTSIDVIRKEINRFSEIMNGKVKRIGVMGGEPLLHPELCEILMTIRHYFSNSLIQLDTNGILLKNQKENFWRTLRDNNIIILQTKYPINLDFDGIEKLCYVNGVKHEYYGDNDKLIKTVYKIPLNLEGRCNPEESFSNCFHANNCVTLQEGKLFPCTIAPNIHIFNDRYGYKLHLCADDYIDIYDKNITEHRVLNFLSNPIPFCRFCDVGKRSFGHEWTVSNKNIDEWVDFC